jgi:DNA-binding NarL/FixJ family response regulator
MPRALALVPDLLFGSRIQGTLRAAGWELAVVGEERLLREQLAEQGDGEGQVLIVDLTDPDVDGAALLRSLRDGGELGARRTLGFYAHVDVSARERAEQAGFDLVVPRSRLAREGAELVERLAAGPDPGGATGRDEVSGASAEPSA